MYDFVHSYTDNLGLFYLSIYILFDKWESIKKVLKESEYLNNYMIFVDYIRSIGGLGTGNKKMLIKTPLILRELRCQNAFKNIPGEFCCVVDQRVKVSAKKLGIKLPTAISNTKYLVKASKIVYENFGDLYDIPLFAYEDVM